jgi:hypothetical protein
MLLIAAGLSPEAILNLSDEELAQNLSQLAPQQPNMAVELPMPVLQAALAAPTSGFTNREIQRLTCREDSRTTPRDGPPHHAAAPYVSLLSHNHYDGDTLG